MKDQELDLYKFILFYKDELTDAERSVFVEYLYLLDTEGDDKRRDYSSKIAKHLNISPETVRVHRKNIFDKLWKWHFFFEWWRKFRDKTKFTFELAKDIFDMQVDEVQQILEKILQEKKKIGNWFLYQANRNNSWYLEEAKKWKIVNTQADP